MTFYLKALLSYLLVVVVIVSLGSLWINKQLISFQRETTYKFLESQAHILANLFNLSDIQLDGKVDVAARDVGWWITIVNGQGKVLADSQLSGQDLQTMENQLLQSEIVQAVEEGFGNSIRYNTRAHRWLLYVAIPLPEQEGFLRLGVSLAEVDQRIPSVQMIFLVAVFSLLCVGLGIASIVFRRVQKSLALIIRATQKFSRKKFKNTIPVFSSEGFKELAFSIEKMSGDLDKQMSRLRSEKDHLTTIFSSMSEGVLVTDKRGQVVDINPAFRKMFEVNVDPVGLFPLEVVRNSEIQQGIKKVLTEQCHYQIKISFSESFFLASFAPFESGGDSGGVVVVFHDITRRERLEDFRREFVSNVSHELKTPLTSIQGYSETLLIDDLADDIRRDFLKKIYRNAKQLSEMIEALLKLASVEHQMGPVELQETDLEDLLKELQSELKPKLQDRDVLLEVKKTENCRTFMARSSYVKSVLHNLIENALEHSQSPKIRLNVQYSENHLQFSVKDYGVGISPDDLGRVFERFYRVHKDRSRQTGGTGIGLALVKHIVQLHGGRTWVESEPGQGATFYFTLPQD